jgi:UrcA family protein
MTNSIAANARRNGALVTFALAALAIVGARAYADEPDRITISAPVVKTVDRDDATGAPITQTTITARVQYDPVTLTLNSGAATLQDSVNEAARKACDSIDPFDPDDGSCVRRAVESAKPQIDAAVAKARSTANG